LKGDAKLKQLESRVQNLERDNSPVKNKDKCEKLLDENDRLSALVKEKTELA